MKICQLCAVDFTFHHFLQPLALALQVAGHEVVGVAADGPFVARVRAAGIRFEIMPFSRSLCDIGRHVAVFRRLVAFFRRERFDLVHVHTPVAAFIGRMAAAAAGVPRIAYTAHGFYFHERMPLWQRAPYVALEWVAGRVTDVLLTQAEEDAAIARRLGLCRGGRIAAIGNGVDPARFRPDANGEQRRRLRAELGTPEGAVVVVVIGRLVQEKGYPELFDAIGDVPAHLWVVGDRLPSDHNSRIDQAIAAVRADPDRAGRVVFLGYRADVPDVLAAADIFVLPSHREGMPRSIIEAMMSALPVVATDIRGAREEVVEAETGALVPVGDSLRLAAALRRLVHDPNLRRRQGEAGRRRALSLYDERQVIQRQLSLLGLGGVGS
ncbi:MAG: glycosyltransferase family 1 protein [Alphaproteobacteria bacterium]|nr:glycosyltransferase family 1 protein [Alphaproteobacteria bacterium]